MSGNGYRNIINSIATPVIVLNDQGEIQDANSPVLTLLGWNNVAGKSFKDIFGSSNQNTIKELLDTVKSGPNGSVFEISLKHSSGLDIQSHVKAMPILDDESKVKEIVLTFVNEKGIDLSKKTRSVDDNWLSNQGRYLLSINDWDDLLEHSGRGFAEICQPAVVLILTNISPRTLQLEAAYGIGKSDFRKAWKIIGKNFLKDNQFEIEDRFKESYLKRRLVSHPGGLEDFAKNHVSPVISRQIAKTFNIGDIYTIGLEGDQQVHGVVYIFTRDQGQILPTQIIESFAFQVALALEKIKYARELKNSESRFQTIFEHAPDAYYLYDSQGRFLDGNLAAEKMVGYERDELIGKSFLDIGLLPKDQLGRVGNMVAKNLLGLPTGPDWIPLVRKDGSVLDVEITTHPVKINDQRVVLGIARDISERKESEQNIEKAHSNLKHVLEGIDAHVYVSDMDTYKILYMNQAMIDDFGGDHSGKICYQVFRGQNSPCENCTNPVLLDNAGETSETVIWEGRNERTGKWYRNYDRAISWIDKKNVRLQIAVDITEKVHAERELAQSELQFRSLFESSHNALMTLSLPDWNFTSGNPALIEMFGFESLDEFFACRPWDISPEFQPDGSSSVDKAKKMINIAVEEGSNTFNWLHKRITGEVFPAMVQLTRVDINDSFFIQATVIDITDRVNSEKSIQQQMDHLSIINQLNVEANLGAPLESILSSFTSQVKHNLGAVNAHVYRYDPDQKLIVIEHFSPNEGPRKIIENTLGISIPTQAKIPLSGSSNFSDLVDRREPLVIDQPEKINGFLYETIQAVTGEIGIKVGIGKIGATLNRMMGIRNIAFVPLLSNNQLIGMVDIVSQRTIQESEIAWLKVISEQLSGIIQRIQAEKERKHSFEELELINQATMESSRSEDVDELCGHLADTVQSVNPNAYVLVSLIDPALQAIRIRAVRGIGKLYNKVTRIAGVSPEEITIEIEEFGLADDLQRIFTSGKLEKVPDGLFDLTRGKVPRRVCRAIERAAKIDQIYIAGFGVHGESTGGLIIALRKGQVIQYPGAIETIVNHYAEVFEARFAQEEVLTRKKQLESLRAVELNLSSKLELEDLLRSIAREAATMINAASSGFSVYNPDDDQLIFYAYTGSDSLPDNKVIEVGKGLAGTVWESQETIIVEDYSKWEGRLQDWERIGSYSMVGIPVCWGDEPLGVLEIALPIGERIPQSRIAMLEMFATQAAIAIKNARLFEAEFQKRQEAETLRELGMFMNSNLGKAELLDLILESLQKVVPYHSASVQLVRGEDCVIEAFRSEQIAEDVIGKRFKISENKLAHPVLFEGKRLILDDVTENGDWIRGDETRGIRSWLAVPLQVKDQCIGVLTLDHKNISQYSKRDASLAMNFANQAAIALENSRLLEEARQRLYRIESLRQIDLAISGSMDLEISMNVLVRQLITSLDVDAATVLIFNNHLNTLNYISGHGFTTDSLKYTNLRLGEGLAGRAALSKEMVLVKDLSIQTTSLKRSPFLSKEKFVSYVAYPLVAKAQIVGVLEVFHRSRLEPNEEWFGFLSSLAGQAAIAIDRINLFIDLEKSNLDLVKAYDATIEGWAKAIELRDRETEGHSRRVVDLTIKLAMRMGVSGEDLLNIRRGALLHDIGKMAIPDGILLKPGKLSEDEWRVMKEHPVYAFQMLSPIEYLNDALDIPYLHHERWDGTGYPQGIKGEEIPLAARIFAVVDVWDALQSDRPYRPAWTEKQALEHIRDMSGSHFDPQVASEFLDMVKKP